MYVASQNGHPEVVDLLVQAGADIHLTETKVNTVFSLVGAVVETNVKYMISTRFVSFPDHALRVSKTIEGAWYY